MAKQTTGAGSRAKTASRTTKTAVKAKTPKPDPVVVSEAEPVIGLAELKKAELINDAVERSGVKKKFAKPAIEAALAVLGEALAEGRGLNLRPMGKMKILRSKDVANGRVLTTRVRQPLPKIEDEEALADPSE